MLQAVPQVSQASKESAIPPGQFQLDGTPVIQYYKKMDLPESWYTEDTQILFIKKGKIRMRFGNVYHEFESNQMVMLKKNIWIELTDAGTDVAIPPEIVLFTIPIGLIREFAKLITLPTIGFEIQTAFILQDGNITWLNYIHSLEAYFQEKNRLEGGLLKIKMLELLYQISINNKYILAQLLDIRDHYRKNITSIVEENITNQISINKLANLSGRSLSSFKRDFMAIYNMPPSLWIRLKRLEKAKELLLSTTMTVTDVCYTLGFENTNHFSRLFKSHFGQSPSEFKYFYPAKYKNKTAG